MFYLDLMKKGTLNLGILMVDLIVFCVFFFCVDAFVDEFGA